MLRRERPKSAFSSAQEETDTPTKGNGMSKRNKKNDRAQEQTAVKQADAKEAETATMNPTGTKPTETKATATSDTTGASKVPTPASKASTPADPKELTEREQKAARRSKLHKRHMRALRNLILRILMLALVVYILFFHLVGVTVMPNGDMYPRIDAGDLVVYYRLEHNIHAQDIVVLEKPTASLEESYEEIEAMEAETQAEKTAIRKALDWLGFRDPAEPPKTTFVCRVVAGPGDTVQISEGERLMVNGNTMIESNIFYATPEYTGFVNYPLTLGEGEYFVLADYRNGGADSRFFGPVREDDILGTVITILRRNNL